MFLVKHLQTKNYFCREGNKERKEKICLFVFFVGWAALFVPTTIVNIASTWAQNNVPTLQS